MEYSDIPLLKKYWLFAPLIAFYLHQFTSRKYPLFSKSNRKKDYRKTHQDQLESQLKMEE